MTLEMSVATRNGLIHLSGDGDNDFPGRDVGAVARDQNKWWAIVEAHEIWSGAPGSWRRAATHGEHRLNCIIPTQDGAVVGTSDARLGRVTVDGAFSFVEGFDAAGDRGEWFTPWGGPPDVRSIAFDDGTMFVNVHVGGILRSKDGASFTPTIDINSDVHEVMAASGTLLAATARGLATSDDSGDTWSFETSGLHATYCRAVAAVGDTVFMSASVGPYGGRAALYRRTPSGAFSKFEGGLPEWFSDNIDTGCLAAREQTVAFATSDGRVFVSEDLGETWTEAASDLAPARLLIIT
jgi:hypothetical protein